jgi:hypothetical protein
MKVEKTPVDYKVTIELDREEAEDLYRKCSGHSTFNDFVDVIHELWRGLLNAGVRLQ